MSKINGLQDELPEMTHEFTIDLIGRITKRRFVGEFKCKIPTIKDQTLIGKHVAALNGEFPIYLDPAIQNIHKWISYLRYTLIDTPLFWRNNDLGFALHDDNIIEAVYDEVMAFEDKWLKQVWGEEDENGSTEDKKES